MRSPAFRPHGFPKSLRLRKRAEFRRTYDEGTPYRNAGFHLFLRTRQESGPPRIGFTVSRRVGKAVIRNRLKRWGREAFRHIAGQLPDQVDLVLNAHPSLARKTHEEFDGLFYHVLRKARLLPEPVPPSPSGEKRSPHA